MELKGLIVSCQLEGDYYKDVLSRSKVINWMINECLRAGVNQVRLCGAREIELARREFGNDIVIIGCTKTYDKKGFVRITKSVGEILSIYDMCNFVATERLSRQGFDGKIDDESLIFEPDDGSKYGYEDVVDGNVGLNYIATTLMGYRRLDFEKNMYYPTLDVLEMFTSCYTNVIAEGGFFEPCHITKAFQLGVKAVCIGAAITKPKKIIERYKSLCGGL